MLAIGTLDTDFIEAEDTPNTLENITDVTD
jgi:hypothetical protein